MLKTFVWVLAATLAASGAAEAQGYKPVSVVRTLSGLQCMALSAAYGPQGTYAPPVPVYAGSESGSAKVGIGAGVILVPDPVMPVNGRSEVLRPNGSKAWIDVNVLTPWHSVNDPSAKCEPVLLSNGRYGFSTSR